MSPGEAYGGGFSSASQTESGRSLQPCEGRVSGRRGVNPWWADVWRTEGGGLYTLFQPGAVVSLLAWTKKMVGEDPRIWAMWAVWVVGSVLGGVVRPLVIHNRHVMQPLAIVAILGPAYAPSKWWTVGSAALLFVLLGIMWPPIILVVLGVSVCIDLLSGVVA